MLQIDVDAEKGGWAINPNFVDFSKEPNIPALAHGIPACFICTKRGNCFIHTERGNCVLRTPSFAHLILYFCLTY